VRVKLCMCTERHFTIRKVPVAATFSSSFSSLFRDEKPVEPRRVCTELAGAITNSSGEGRMS
jgi:hypothetical protein